MVEQDDEGTRTSAQAVALSAAQRITDALARRLAPGLYVVATPIGNLGDMTLRGLAVLAAADVVYCEDTRHSRTLLATFGIGTRLRSYHDHNAEAERPRILEALAGGARIALISDAGTPLVSDPGYKLVRAAIEAGHLVHSVPGASALLAALVASGLPSDRFLFAGFLPPRQAARRDAIAGLAGVDATLVLFEAPGRIAESLADLAHGLGAREAVVARELTKLYEENLRGTLETLSTEFAQRDFKGEIVIVIAPPAPASSEVTDLDIAAALGHALEGFTLRDAVRAVADKFGVPKKRVYDIGLAMKRDAP
jgi:16S rRNA (cytidine1402-2'-O)-methyltransferase